MRRFSMLALAAGVGMAWVSASAQAQQEIAGQGGGNTAGAMNPDFSLDGLFSLSQFNRDNPVSFKGGHDPHQNGFQIQQVEMTFGANVDPYFRADANLVLTSEGIEIEEAYATTLSLPLDLQFKGGQFLTAFGRHNPTHPHTWDYANKPLVLGRFFGGDGLRNPGVQVSWLSPLPWYSELIGSLQNSQGDNAQSFNQGASGTRTLGDAIALARWNNFFSLSEDFSLNVGGSFLTGKNNQDLGTRTRIVGGDVFLKYRKPDGLSYIGLQIEALQRYYDTLGSGQVSDWGGYAQLEYRLPEGWERWHVGLRYDYVGQKPTPVVTSQGGDGSADPDLSRRFRISPVVTFYPSEFSKLRLQYDYDKPDSFDVAQQAVILQLEFVIGAHGAHKF